jgi:hypothetical protein
MRWAVHLSLYLTVENGNWENESTGMGGSGRRYGSKFKVDMRQDTGMFCWMEGMPCDNKRGVWCWALSTWHLTEASYLLFLIRLQYETTKFEIIYSKDFLSNNHRE